MIKNVKLATKMVMSFGLLAFIALIIGLVGGYGLSENDKALEDIGFNHMPTVENLYVIKERGNELVAATRTLLDLSLDKAMRQEQYDNITHAREIYETAWKRYESLPHSPEEVKQWKEFGGAWQEWRAANNSFMNLSRKLEEFDFGNPMELSGKLELFRGDHYKTTTALLKMVNEGKLFEGGENHEACNMGKWLTTFKTSNPTVHQLQQDIHEPHRKFHKGVRELKVLVSSGRIDEAMSVYADLNGSMESIFSKLDDLRKIAKNGLELQNEAEHTLIVTADESQQKAYTILDEMITNSSDSAEQLAVTAERQANKFKLVMVSVAIAGVALALVISLVVTRAITTPLTKAVGIADELSKGNLTVSVKADSNDETGQLLTAMDGMASSLRAMFNDISKGVETLTSSSTEMASVSEQLSAAANDTADKSSSVSSASEEMSANFQSVSAAMEQATSNINMIATSTEEMTATVKEIGESAEKARTISDGAVKQSKATSGKMTDLGESAKKIGRVTETITEISEQTNLLALNATIEAARAGEAGKGFAVVANEIKELARQTAEATVDIKDQIGDMQSTTNATIEDITQISEVIAEINNVINGIATAVEEQSAATNEIAGNIAESSLGISEVNENVAQSTVVVADITRDVSTISSQSTQVGASSVQVQTSAQTLFQVAEQLKGLVSKFKV